jgi:hypothetical protein
LAFVTYTSNGNSSTGQTLGTKGDLVSNHSCTTIDELRKWTRFEKERGTDVALVFHSQHEQILADVHDESRSGIGLYLEDIQCFDVGQEVEVIYDSEFFQARVSHIEPHQKGGYIVGFSCKRESVLEASTKEAASIADAMT